MKRDVEQLSAMMESFEPRRLMSGVTEITVVVYRTTETTSLVEPVDPYGDVKNLDSAPGGNDSVWIDLGSPVRQTSSTGSAYTFTRDGRSSGL